jgi:hypothetical protein
MNMEYKIYEINNSFWAIAEDIEFFKRKLRRKFKRPVAYKECDMDSEGMYEPLEIFEDSKALEGKKDITIDDETYRYVSFRDMLKEFNLDGSAISFWGIRQA